MLLSFSISGSSPYQACPSVCWIIFDISPHYLNKLPKFQQLKTPPFYNHFSSVKVERAASLCRRETLQASAWFSEMTMRQAREGYSRAKD